MAGTFWKGVLGDVCSCICNSGIRWDVLVYDLCSKILLKLKKIGIKVIKCVIILIQITDKMSVEGICVKIIGVY